MKIKYINPDLQMDINVRMTEIIPVLKELLFKQYGYHFVIQYRYILSENRLKSILDEGTYHLTIEYYVQPISVYLVLPNHIKWNNKFSELISKENEIILEPMNINEDYDRKKREEELQHLIKSEDIMLISKEEKDLTYEELKNPENWKSQKIAFRERDINPRFLKFIRIACMNLQSQDADAKRKVK